MVLGLGCENNSVSEFKKELGDYDSKRIKFLVTQDVEDELETGMQLIEELINIVEKDQRENCPVSDLVIGMKCGGSDQPIMTCTGNSKPQTAYSLPMTVPASQPRLSLATRAS